MNMRWRHSAHHVDDDIEPIELRRKSLIKAPQLRRFGRVGGFGQCLSAQLFNRRAGGFQRVLLDIAKGYVNAGAGQRRRNRRADPERAANNDRDLSLQIRPIFE